ncbi:MAG: hypothetical protein RL456_2102 [Pseudomonadota bacterium]|jgi:hypothetical protein
MTSAPPAAADHRQEPRHPVTWPGRLTLEDGAVLEVRVRDISAGGVGLRVDRPLPVNRVLPLVLGVPDPDDPTHILAVPVQVRGAYLVLQGHDFRFGGPWVGLQGPAQRLVLGWVERLAARG